MQAKESSRENSDGGADLVVALLSLLCNSQNKLYWIEISMRTRGKREYIR
jgi:hypothetical protein